jgi:4-hydroxy-tetrahydrodipicolinate reductase
VPTYPGRDAVRRSITELLDDSTATPHLVVAAAAVPLQAMLDLAGEVIDRGIDVITLHQDLFSYGASWTPDLHARAVAGGATVMGTGIQDTWWVQLLTLAASGVDAITKITLTNVVPLETLSWGIGEEIGVALSSEEFEAHVRTTAEHPSVIGAPLVDAVQRMGAQAGPLTKSVEPVFGADPYVWSAAGRVLHPGETQGAIERVTFDTDSGFRVEGIISVLPGGAETATGEITIEGVPTTRVAFGPLSKDSTNTALVSRIPDVISAPPGVIFARDLAPARHQFRQRTD